MTNHTRVDFNDDDRSVPGHTCVLVRVLEEPGYGLHCDECDVYLGSYRGRWTDKHINEAWAAHIADLTSTALEASA